MRIFIFITVLFICNNAISQKNTVYYQLLGNGHLSSINYQRQLTKDYKLNVHAGAGLGVSNAKSKLTIPVGINYNFKIKSDEQYITIGTGVTYTRFEPNLYVIIDHHQDFNPKKSYTTPFFNTGYTYKSKKGLFISVFGSLFYYVDADIPIPTVGFSIGKSF